MFLHAAEHASSMGPTLNKLHVMEQEEEEEGRQTGFLPV